jgi:hypothetical protein
MLIGDARNDLPSWNRSFVYIKEPRLIPQSGDDDHSCGCHCIAFIEILLRKYTDVPVTESIVVDDIYRMTIYEILFNFTRDA